MSTAWKRLATFYVLAFALLLVIPIVHGVMTSGPMDFDAAGARASAATGLAWTSSLLVVSRLAIAEPALWLVVFGSAVPSLAALLTCARSSSQMRTLLGRFYLRMPWRRALVEHGLLLLIMIAGLASVFVLRSVLPGPAYSLPAGIVGPSLVGGLLVAAFLDQGAVLEELGWRGYAHHELQSGLLSPVAAAVLIGVAWGLWHVPRDVTGGVVERLGLFQYLLLFLPSFLAGTITISIIAAYFVNRCGGSLIPAIMVHGLSNDAVGLSGMAPMDLVLTPYHQATKALPFVLIAFAIIAITGRQLGLARETDTSR